MSAHLLDAKSSRHPYWSKPVYQAQNVWLTVRLEPEYSLDTTIAMIDGTHVCQLSNCSWARPEAVSSQPSLQVSFPSKGMHTLALYSINTTTDTHVLLPTAPWLINVSILHDHHQLLFARSQSSKPFQAGAYWTPYFTPTALAAIRESERLGKPAPNYETWIRSNGNMSAAEIPGGVAGLWNRYNVQPVLGYYCFYRKRDNEIGIVEDCPNITAVATAQADYFRTVGIDYMLFDHTNFNKWFGPGGADCHHYNHSSTDHASYKANHQSGNTCDADLLQMRPSEVLIEEWAKLRANNYSTPTFGTFNGVRSGENLWQQILLRLYNKYPDLVWQHNGKAVFVTGMATNATTNHTAVQEILANYGGHNITVLPMDDKDDPTSWEYLMSCNTPSGATSIVLPDRPCNASKVVGTPLGSVRTLEAEYAINSWPLSSPGRLDGLTMRAMFQDVIADPSDFVFLPSWNEFVVGNHSMADWAYPTNNTYFTTDGLENDVDDNHFLFLDGWGYGRSRFLEPAVEEGGVGLEMLGSCLRVLRLSTSGLVQAGSCSVANEMCCQLTAAQNVTRVWSLSAHDSGDHMLSADIGEVTALNRSGTGNYNENCNPMASPGPSADDFCANASMPYPPYINKTFKNYNVLRGPFVAWNNYTTTVANTRPLYRCKTSSNTHFVSVDAGCEGQGEREYVLVYISKKLDGRTQRALHQCYGNGLNAGIQAYYHSLNGPCFGNDTDTVLGYVM
eukprot:TRINITY_DN9468_c0_g1_i1.p1 TRINITY_DN9468_c0_g1~~TRINITY_DN9468_c0_g1_i1.p1  ORF type:complete len:754 (+),score=176.02 TRINITY_DN9468_c0_g1_i1:67-2262(+)